MMNFKDQERALWEIETQNEIKRNQMRTNSLIFQKPEREYKIIPYDFFIIQNSFFNEQEVWLINRKSEGEDEYFEYHPGFYSSRMAAFYSACLNERIAADMWKHHREKFEDKNKTPPMSSLDIEEYLFGLSETNRGDRN